MRLLAQAAAYRYNNASRFLWDCSSGTSSSRGRAPACRCPPRAAPAGCAAAAATRPICRDGRPRTHPGMPVDDITVMRMLRRQSRIGKALREHSYISMRPSCLHLAQVFLVHVHARLLTSEQQLTFWVCNAEWHAHKAADAPSCQTSGSPCTCPVGLDEE